MTHNSHLFLLFVTSQFIKSCWRFLSPSSLFKHSLGFNAIDTTTSSFIMNLNKLEALPRFLDTWINQGRAVTILRNVTHSLLKRCCARLLRRLTVSFEPVNSIVSLSDSACRLLLESWSSHITLTHRRLNQHFGFWHSMDFQHFRKFLLHI